MNEDKQEHIREAAQVISRYSDLIALRKCDLMTNQNFPGKNIPTWQDLKKDEAISQLAKYTEKPVINMESNLFHPCQSMADTQTMAEHFGGVENLKNKKYVLSWAPHPKALPLATPHSQLLTPNIFGMNVTLACPKGFELDKDVIALAESRGNKITIENNQEKAFADADIIVAKSWASLQFFGQWEEEQKHRQQFSNWTISQEKMNLTNDAIFMHCLPVRRNVVVTDEVLNSKKSVIIDEAENRMWSQMAIISELLK
jgi:N-acetylornithine carbamoyltransferase